jgi:hypothetical protein
MSFRTIEKLLQKYFEGETSLQEEEQLKAFFQKEDVPPHLISLKDLFITYRDQKSIEPLDEQFDEDLMSKIKSEKVISIKRKRRSLVYAISGIAAVIVVIIAISIYFNVATRSIEDTFKDPQMAYNEAKKVMLFISEKFNRGVQPVGEATAKVEEGLKDLEAVEKFNDGLKEANKLERFNRIQFIFSNTVMP